jgi:hypothetical protein
MSRWFRLYDDTINDPKTLKLSDKTFRVWVGILCATSKNDGVVPPFDDLVIMLRMKAEKLQPEIETLIKAELIDHDDNGMRPHNWNKRQYKSDVSTDRVKRFRNGKGNVAETPPETEADTESEQKEPELRSVDDWPSFFREEFWRAYPLKKGKKAAIGELERVRKRGGVSWDTLMKAVCVYAATADPKFTKHPKTWLTNGCWDDEPDTRNHNGKTASPLIAAADANVAGGISFGPKPNLMHPASRSGAGENVVRLLPEGGRERPGDVHGGDHGNSRGIPGGSGGARHRPEDGDRSEVELPSDCG